MIRIIIGTINIQTVTQAGSVNIGNTLHVAEKSNSPSFPDRERDPAPGEGDAGCRKGAAETVGGRRRGEGSRRGLMHLPPG